MGGGGGDLIPLGFQQALPVQVTRLGPVREVHEYCVK